ncbi:MAG: hypothetical protein SGPRY_013046 [Prymnesium sp.]
MAGLMWIDGLCKAFGERHVYLPFVLAYYNALRRGGTGACHGGCERAIGYGGANYEGGAKDREAANGSGG